MSTWIYLSLMLLVILAAAQLLTNALEYLAQHFKLSSGITGSILAAVATALPEASIPIVAIFAGSENIHANEEIGVGAILGAPLMLVTLALFLIGISAIYKRSIRGYICPEKTGYRRDLHYFLFAFSIAAIAMYIPATSSLIKHLLGYVLISTYIVYLYQTIRASKNLVQSGHDVVPDAHFYLEKIGLKVSAVTIFTQLILGGILLFLGAKGFVHNMVIISQNIGISPLLLSILIVPFATELPEKVNSILWVNRGKDTLALGNITGAMVFQGTLLPAIGIFLTPWQASGMIHSLIIITLLSCLWVRLTLRPAGVPIISFAVCGIFYFLYLYLAMYGMHL